MKEGFPLSMSGFSDLAKFKSHVTTFIAKIERSELNELVKNKQTRTEVETPKVKGR
jgi:hypothetical protein